MIQIEASFEFKRSIEAALSLPDAPDPYLFATSDLVSIVMRIATGWSDLYPSTMDPYRRSLVAGYPLENPRFLYSIRAFLRSDGVIELENMSLDMDFGFMDGSDE